MTGYISVYISPFFFYEGSLKQLAGHDRYQLALNVYERFVADWLEPSPVKSSCLITFVAEVGDMGRAAGFYEKLSAIWTPSIRAYMTLVRALANQRDWSRSLATTRGMQKWNAVVYAIIVSGKGYFTIALVVYLAVAGGAYPSILTMFVLMQCLETCFLVLQVCTSGSAAGAYARALMLDGLAIAFRLSCTVPLDGYFPVEASGDYVFQMIDGVSLLMIFWLLLHVLAVERHIYQAFSTIGTSVL